MMNSFAGAIVLVCAVLVFAAGATLGADRVREVLVERCLEANPEVKYGEIHEFCKNRLYLTQTIKP